MFVGIILVLGTGVAVLLVFVVKSFIVPQKLSNIQKLISNGKYSQAIKQAKMLIVRNPRDSEARYLLGKAYLADGKSELALMEFKAVNATAIFSKTLPETEFRKTLAKLFLKYNQPEEALKETLLLIKLEPFQAEHYYTAGLLFEQRNNSEQALANYRKAVETDPNHATAHASLGLLLFKNKQMTDAKQEIAIALRLDPKNTKAQFYQGKLLRDSHDYANALAAFEKVLRDTELKQKALIERGCCYLEANSTEKAIVEFERAIKAGSDEASNDTLHARYFLASCHEKLRDIDSAIHQWEQIFNQKRSFRDVGEKLSQYQELRSNDSIKEYLTAGREDFFTICKAITNTGLELSVRDIRETKYGCALVAVENDGEKWRNVRKMPRLILFYRDPNLIEDAFLRALQEEMKKQSIIRGIVITSSGFTRSALEFAESRPLELIGREKLEHMLSSVDLFGRK
ncbi:MAG: bacteriophage N4 receptor, outer membrane subunit [Spirochaetes bacterium ADurb.Bin215]|jgi:tetratricopeptide (TPR) repeat protein|nr:MAG: bacteriophage N4 receptor, outer membrane subunit [Spirochaetes bacterium ADurb.Bin215]